MYGHRLRLVAFWSVDCLLMILLHIMVLLLLTMIMIMGCCAFCRVAARTGGALESFLSFLN